MTEKFQTWLWKIGIRTKSECVPFINGICKFTNSNPRISTKWFQWKRFGKRLSNEKFSMNLSWFTGDESGSTDDHCSGRENRTTFARLFLDSKRNSLGRPLLIELVTKLQGGQFPRRLILSVQIKNSLTTTLQVCSSTQKQNTPTVPLSVWRVQRSLIWEVCQSSTLLKTRQTIHWTVYWVSSTE